MQTTAATTDDPINVDQAIQRYRRRAVLALQGAFLFGASIGLILFHETLPVRYATLASSMLSAASLGLAWRYRLPPAILVLSFQFLILPVALSLTALGVYDSGMLIMPAGMLAIALVERPPRVILFSLANICAAAVVFYASVKGLNGTPLPAVLAASVHVDGITQMIVLLFCGMVAGYISYVLSSLLDALQLHQIELENKVSRRTAELTEANSELTLALEALDEAKHELVRTEKLASLGSLVAGVAHELNTPIGNASVAATTIEAHIESFSGKVASAGIRRSELDSFLLSCREGSALVVRSLGRARDLVASFKQVAVDQASERRRQFTLDEVIGDVLRTLKPGLAGLPWTIEDNVAHGIHCDGYPGPLGQILTNLINNAIFHGFEGRDKGAVRIEGKGLADGWLEISVTDDGRGIPAESLGKIFDPFYTTRLGHGGSGLGLTICHNLASSVLGGSLAVTSVVGQGTVFMLRLPRAAPLGPRDPDDVIH